MVPAEVSASSVFAPTWAGARRVREIAVDQPPLGQEPPSRLAGMTTPDDSTAPSSSAFPPPPGYGWGPGYGAPAPTTTNGFAVASLVLGIAGCFLMLPSPLAVVFGHVALSQLKRRPERGRGPAQAGLITGYIGSFFLLIVLVAALDGAFDGSTY